MTKIIIDTNKTYVGNNASQATEKTIALLPETWEEGKVPVSTGIEGIFEWGDGGSGGSGESLGGRSGASFYDVIPVESATLTTPPSNPPQDALYYLSLPGEYYTAWQDLQNVILQAHFAIPDGESTPELTWRVWAPTDSLGLPTNNEKTPSGEEA